MKYLLTGFATVAFLFWVNAQTTTNYTVGIKEGKLSITVTAVSNKNKLVIIVPGSGPTDRNGNSILGVKTNAYLQLAEQLAANNIASLRYDKRGIGESVLKNNDESKQRFTHFVEDVIALYQYAKDSLGYQSVYIAGHSEGALVAMLAAQQVNVAGYISIAGAARCIDEIIMEQVSNQPIKIQEEVKTIFDSLKNNKTVAKVPSYLYALFRPSVQPYMISWLQYTPEAEIAKLKIPMLIINGTCDVQVKPQEAERLQKSNPKAQLQIIEGMTHVLKQTETDCEQGGPGTYNKPDLPIDEALLKYISNFINNN